MKGSETTTSTTARLLFLGPFPPERRASCCAFVHTCVPLQGFPAPQQFTPARESSSNREMHAMMAPAAPLSRGRYCFIALQQCDLTCHRWVLWICGPSLSMNHTVSNFQTISTRLDFNLEICSRQGLPRLPRKG